MTYFDFKKRRSARGEAVYVGTRFIGRVAVKTDWPSKLAHSATSVDLYSATQSSGATHAARPLLLPTRRG